MRSTPSSAASSAPAPGPPGPSHCAAASPARWPRPPPGTPPRLSASRFCNSRSPSSGTPSEAQPRTAPSASSATSPSSSTWTPPTSRVHPDLFELDADLQPIRIAGVPPDYFSATGQRWGNPLYRWDVLAERGFDCPIFAWWTDRIRRARQLYDIIRLDHFRGFEAYWAIPAEEETAVNGKWIKAPGLELFTAIKSALGPVPLVAEDLGMITPEVDALRLQLGLPGMKVLQFGFSDKGAHIHLPHRFAPATLAYTGTHDNDTTQGWWNTAPTAERAAVEAYLGPVANRPVWPLIRAAAASVAQIAVVPAQDLLELGSEARMNTPAVAAGNWSWRAPASAWAPTLTERLAALAEVTDRDNDPLGKPQQDSST